MVTAQNHGNTKTEEIITMFDLCSSHHFITSKTVKTLNLKKSGIFEGEIQTVQGKSEANHDIFKVKLLDEYGNYRTIDAI